VPDQPRIAFLGAYTAAMFEAMNAGVDVRGYFVWSLLDNFEWRSAVWPCLCGLPDAATAAEGVISLVRAAHQEPLAFSRSNGVTGRAPVPLNARFRSPARCLGRRRCRA
jgi:hypothetical protein